MKLNAKKILFLVYSFTF